MVCKLCVPNSKADDVHDVNTAYGAISHNSLACKILRGSWWVNIFYMLESSLFFLHVHGKGRG